MRAGIIVFPGTNCDQDTKRACEHRGWDTEFIWHDESELFGYDILFLPGGFSYGDYIRAGRIAKFSPAVIALKEYVKNRQGLVIGICNGFQILCEAGLLPGALAENLNTKFICDVANLEMDGKLINLPIAHAEGRYICDRDSLMTIQEKGMNFLKYIKNPNGSVLDIAGLYDSKTGVIGLMPHPERAMFKETGLTDGNYFFKMLEAQLCRL